MNRKAAICGRLSSWVRRLGQVAITDDISLDAPPERALSVLRHLPWLARYEPKVDAVRIEPATRTSGSYTARGRFAGLPWWGRFSYELRTHGFHSEMIEGPSGMRVSGGFVVRREDQCGCRVLHYERYLLPWWLWPFALPLRLYLKQAMRNELRAVAQLILRPEG